MPNSLLDKSTFYKGEPIVGHFIITVDEEDPAIPSIEILNSSLEFVIKDDKLKSDSEALLTLTVDDGLEVVSNTPSLYNVNYRIPGSLTADLEPANARDTTITLFYKIKIIYEDETEFNVLESGTIKFRVD